MLVAFPTGRVQPGLERITVVTGWAAALVFSPLGLLVVKDPGDCDDCPENLLLVWDNETAADIVEGLGVIVTVALLVAVGVILVRRWRSFGPVQRRALAPVVWIGAGLAAVAAAAVLPLALGADEVLEVGNSVLIVLITAVPFAFLLGLLRSSLSRAGAVSALFDRLGGVGARDALAEALGDDSLALAYWLPDQGRYVDAAGHTVALPAGGDGRAVTTIEREGAPVAAIVHDPSLLEERELVRTAGAAAALALENERLAAEVRARYDDLRAASARLVAAGDAARRKIERDLHDGAQQRLVSLSLTLNLARKNAEPGSQAAKLLDSALTELAAGLAELRELARGIHPAVLTERGLEPALKGLAARAPLPVTVSGRCGEPARARCRGGRLLRGDGGAHQRRQVRLRHHRRGHRRAGERPCGRRRARRRDRRRRPGRRERSGGLADRVAALGGRLVVESPPGGGPSCGRTARTTIRARYLIDVAVRSQKALAWLTTPLTSWTGASAACPTATGCRPPPR